MQIHFSRGVPLQHVAMVQLFPWSGGRRSCSLETIYTMKVDVTPTPTRGDKWEKMQAILFTLIEQEIAL